MASTDNQQYKTLVVEHRNGAINQTLTEEMLDYFGKLYFRHEVRVVVLRGAGKHFCSGLDLNDAGHFGASNPADMRGQRLISEIIMRMRRCPQPIIALMQGAATGGGFAFALACDVRYAADNAKMNVAMTRIGLTGCDVGISYFLPRSVGTSNAAEMMMSGRFVFADKALRIGLVSEVVPAEALEATGQTLVNEMLAMSPLGLRMTKEGLNISQDAGGLEAVVAMEDRGQVLCIAPFLEEGGKAFLEKRAAIYNDD
jgi:enoyl-CoA hydratase/carnithine racemase